MENEPRTVFDRLDGVENKVDSIDEKIDELLKAFVESEHQKAAVVQKPAAPTAPKPADKNAALREFMKSATKEYLWLGPSSKFRKAKTLLCINALALVILGIFPTVFTSIALGFYSPFSILENIWLVFSIVLSVYAFNFKERMLDTDLRSHSCENYKQDRDLTWRIYSEKKSFIWFRRFSNISCLANIAIIWFRNQGPASVVATIFEILLFALSITFIFSYASLTCMYGNFILYTNKNDVGDKVTLVFDVMGKKLITYEDFRKKFGKIFL